MRITLALILSMLVSSSYADDTIHLVRPGNALYQKLSTSVLQSRLVAAARQYQQYGQVARIAFFDLAYPATEDENQEMKGFGILWITALSQDPKELPIRNVK